MTDNLTDATATAMPGALSLALPLYNEERNVRAVAGELREAFEAAGIALELVLVDNGSTDGTAREIEALAASDRGVKAVRLTPNAGYGGGILAGLAACSSPVIGYTWGDGQVSAADHVEVYRKLLAEGLDLCKARRVERHDGLRRRLITTAYNAVVFPLLFGVTSTDINGCPKMFRRERFAALGVTSRDWFLDPEIMIRAVELGFRIGEVPVVFLARRHGRSNVKWRTVVEFCRNLAAYRIARLRGRPFRTGAPQPVLDASEQKS